MICIRDTISALGVVKCIRRHHQCIGGGGGGGYKDCCGDHNTVMIYPIQIMISFDWYPLNALNNPQYNQ